MSRLGKVLRWLLVLAAICAVVWLPTVIWWQETHRAVDEADVLLFIVLLPLTLFAVVLALWFGIRALRRARRPVLAGVAAVASSPAARTDEDLLHAATLHVQAIAMNTLAGTDAAGVLAALVENRAAAKASASLFDDDGFRIMLARHDSLDVSAAEGWTAQHLESLDSARHPAEHEIERIQRCLALLQPALDDVLPAVEGLLKPPPTPVPTTPVRPSAKVVTAAAPPPPTLRVVLLVAAEYSDAARAVVKAWLEPRLAQAASAIRAPVLLSLLPTTIDTPPVLLIDRFNVEVHRQPAHDVLLLIGVDSCVGEGCVRALERSGTLRTAARPGGEVPGEGAFFVVLTSDAVRAADREPLACLHRVTSVARTRPPEVRGKVSSTALRESLQTALANAAVTPDHCAAMICDGDGYGPRGIEAAEALSFTFDHLDAVADRLVTGVVLGRLGAATLPALLCIAAAQVTATQKGCVIAPLAAPLDRAVLLATAAEPVVSAPPSLS